MGLFDKFKKNSKNEKIENIMQTNFSKEYKISEKLTKESTINHITEGKLPITTSIYNYGIISVLDIDTSVNIMKSWKWRFCDIFVPIISTAFGDLFLYSARSEKCYFFQPQYDSLEEITDSIDELLNDALINDGIKKGVLLEEKFNKVSSILGHIKYSDTYILKPWLMLGGKDVVENYSIGNLTVYLELVSKSLE